MAITHTASASTAAATDLMRDSYAKAIEGGQVYNNKLLEFSQTNSKVAFDFAQKLIAVKSPSEFIELSTEHARKQFESLTEQTKELTDTRSAGHARDRGAAEDRHRQGGQPRGLTLLVNFRVVRSRVARSTGISSGLRRHREGYE
jgi:hypothetical protein